MDPVHSASSALSFDQAKQNLFTIRACPKAIYAVGENGELKAISRWNVLGRLYQHIKGHSNIDAVKKVIGDSINTVESNVTIKSCFFKRAKIWKLDLYIKNQPFSNVVKDLKAVSLIKKDPNLSKNADALETKCNDLYAQIKQVKGLFHDLFEVPSEIQENDTPEAIDSLFEKHNVK